jgi:TRAP-type mannitol/chloroaromatic compound transport system permease small subunit
MRALVRGIDAVSRFFGFIAAILVVVLVVLMLYDVLLRYAFNKPTSWGNDLNTMLMGASFVLSIAYAMATDSHVRVDLLFTEATKPRLRIVDVIGLTLVVLPAVAVITWGLWGHFQTALASGERTGSGGWNPVVWPFRLLLFVGFLIFTVQIVAEIVKRIASLAGRPLVAVQSSADHGV